MKIKFKNFLTIIKHNLELCFLILMLLITTLSIQTFNLYKEKQKKNVLSILNNLYLEKTLENIIENLDPRYVNIEHKISSGETFDNILKGYQIPLKEITVVKKVLSKKNNLNNLKKDQTIKFTIDTANSKKILEFIFSINRTKKIKISRSLADEHFIYEEIITYLDKKLIYREGKILKRASLWGPMEGNGQRTNGGNLWRQWGNRQLSNGKAMGLHFFTIG